MQRRLTHVEVPRDVAYAIEPIGDSCRPTLQKFSNVSRRLNGLLAEGLEGVLAAQMAVIGQTGTGKSSLIEALVQRPGMIDSAKRVTPKEPAIFFLGDCQDLKSKLTPLFYGQTMFEIQLDQHPFAVPTALTEISGALEPPLGPSNGFRIESIPSLDACVVVLDAARMGGA